MRTYAAPFSATGRYEGEIASPDPTATTDPGLGGQAERAWLTRLALATLERNFRLTGFTEFDNSDRELLLSSLAVAREAYRRLN